MLETPNLCFVDIWSFHTKGKGMTRMIKSTSTSEIDKPQKLAVWSIQYTPGLPGGRVKDKLMGVQSNRVEKKKATPHMTTSTIVVILTAEKTAPRKIRR